MCLRHNRSHLTKMRWSQKEILFSSCVQKTKSINSMNFLRLSVALQCAGTLVSIVSLCFLLVVYLSYKELRNLLGKCLISPSWALLCYQIIFLCSEKSKEVDAVCKLVAICLHFFVLAAYSWMSVLTFDTANTFKLQAGKKIFRLQIQILGPNIRQ